MHRHLSTTSGSLGAGQRGDDDRQLGARRGVAVAAGTAHDVAVGIGVDVDVKVQVHLGCAQQDDVQVVHACALAADARVLGRGNLHVFGVGANRFNRLQVKALYIQQRLKAALVEHVDHVSGDAAHAVAALDALFKHHFLDIFGGGQGRAARTGLEGEAVLEQAGRLDDLGRRSSPSSGLPGRG